MRRILTLPFLLLNLCVLGTSCWAADVFDKAEGIARNYKECANSGANCEASKWLNRAVQLDKCAKEGNCAQKAGQKIAEHQDSIEAAVHKLARINQCAEEYLRSQGVSRRITTLGVGEREPVAANSTDSGRQKNRRVEVAIYANEALQDAARREAGGQ